MMKSSVFIVHHVNEGSYRAEAFKADTRMIAAHARNIMIYFFLDGQERLKWCLLFYPDYCI